MHCAPTLAAALLLTTAAVVGAATPTAPTESFWTPFDPTDEVMDLAIWHGAVPADPAAAAPAPATEQNWLFAAGAATDRLVRYDATTGQRTLYVGRPGDGLGELRRPVSLAVAGDLLVIAEQSSRRLQVFGLPGFTLLGAFGADTLRQPLAIAARITSAGLEVAVLDGGPAGEASRLWRFGAAVTPNGVTAAAPLRLRDAPAGTTDLAVDPQDGRLALVSPRQLLLTSPNGEPLAPAVAAFGNTSARAVGLLACPDGTGAWVVAAAAATSAGAPPAPAIVSLFDRANLAVRGSFSARSAAGATGLAITTRLPNQPRGSLFLGHLGQGAIALDLGEIAAATGSRPCGASAPPSGR